MPGYQTQAPSPRATVASHLQETLGFRFVTEETGKYTLGYYICRFVRLHHYRILKPL